MNIILFQKIFRPYFKWRNSKLKENQKYSNTEYQKILASKFSIAEIICFNCLVLSSMLLFFVGLVFAIYFLEHYIQSNYLVPTNIILSGSTILSKIIFIFIGIISGVFLNNIFLNFIGYTIPRFNTFVTRNRTRMTGLTEIENKEKKIKDIKISFKILYMTLLFTAPILFFALDNYYYVNSKGITYNSFFSFKEKNYNWKEIQKVTISAKPHKYEGKLKFDLSYNIVTKDNNSFNIWGNDFQKILNINSIINSKGIIIEKIEITHELVNYINNSFYPENAKIILKILMNNN